MVGVKGQGRKERKTRGLSYISVQAFYIEYKNAEDGINENLKS